MFEAALLETKSAAGCEKDTQDNPPVRPARNGASYRARYRPRRSTTDRLREALLALAGQRAKLITHEETAWSSITFTGTRHEITLDFDGRAAVEVGEEFIANLPDHEFRIPGQLVADASVREVDHRFGADERMIVTAVLLLLEES